MDIIEATATAGELLARGLGWGAWLIHQAVAEHTDKAVREAMTAWMTGTAMYKLSGHGMCGVKMGSSPRFDFYSCDFGWGKPAAVRSGRANKYEGKVTFHPGREGGWEHGFGHLLGAGVHEDAAVRRRVHESRLPTSGAGDQLVQAKSRSHRTLDRNRKH
ncbi:hypothetical protein BHM03_00035446 [Ensete ventricosum]|nr:hypothetical protein BHM03_00035446 [Ensete ventricosum]